MEQNPNLSQNVDALFSNLGNFTQNEGVLGKPVTHGEKTFIPVVSVTLGYGSGDKASKNDHGASSQGGTNPVMGMGNMSGGAIGLGARLCTEAVIVIDQDNVSAIPIKAGANANQLMDKIPQILSGMNQNKQQGQQQGQQQNQAQSQQQQ